MTSSVIARVMAIVVATQAAHADMVPMVGLQVDHVHVTLRAQRLDARVKMVRESNSFRQTLTYSSLNLRTIADLRRAGGPSSS